MDIALVSTIFVLLEAILLPASPFPSPAVREGTWAIYTILGQTSLSIFFITEAYIPLPSFPEASIPLLARLILIPAVGDHVAVTYPFLPWLPFTLYGICFAISVRKASRSRIVTHHLWHSLALLSLFLVIRLYGGWGNIYIPDHHPSWDNKGRNPFTSSFISFFNVTKYPPSLAYGTFTLGTFHLILAALYALPWASYPLILGKVLSPWIDFGQSALFFFGVHHLAYIPAPFIVSWVGWSEGGQDLWQVYLLWILGLALLWPACRFYGRWKRQKPEGSLWRFF